MERIRGHYAEARLPAQIPNWREALEGYARERKEWEQKAKSVRDRRDALMQNLGAMTGGGMENVRELHETSFDMVKKRPALRRLVTLLRSDLAIAMAGKALRDRVRSVIHGEVLRTQWLAGKEQTRDGLPHNPRQFRIQHSTAQAPSDR